MSKLRFDYFELHRQSIGLLRRLKLDLDIDYIKFFGGRYIENESPLPYLGGWAIVAATSTAKVAKVTGLTDSGSQLLHKAATVMGEYLREEGIIP